jgi:hypothetical protein
MNKIKPFYSRNGMLFHYATLLGDFYFRRSSNFRIFVLALGIFLLGYTIPVHADDPGITKVRLIQQTDTSYLLEADVPQILLNTIKRPVLPDRFAMTEFDFSNQSGWITLKMTLATSGSSLSPDDEILLPWLRNGIDFTAQWLDGSTYKGLFNRSLNGILIPLEEVMPTSKTTMEVLQESFMMGVKHIRFHYIHLLFILILILSAKDFSVFKLLLWFSFGQASSMIVAELGWTGIDLLYSDLLLLILTGVFAYALAYNRSFMYDRVALFTTGLFHGISFVQEISAIPLEPIQRIQALFAFNVGIDLTQYILGFLLLLIFPFFRKILPDGRKLGIAAGSISIFLIMLVYQQHIRAGIVQVLEYGSTKSSTSINVPVSGNPSTRQVQRSSGIMTTPYMLFLSIEPYEVRQEILMTAEDVLREFKPGYKEDLIPVPVQEELKSQVSQNVINNTEIRINGKGIQPGDMNVNFVHLSRGGVSIRENPIEESVQDGVMGITIIYDIETLPDSVDVKWAIFTDSVQMVEASVVDAHGAFTKILSLEDTDIQWKNRLAGYQVPVIEAIMVKPYPLPLLSLVFITGIIIAVLVMMVRRKPIRYIQVIAGILVIAFIMYPFIRTSASVPLISNWVPSKERTGALLNDLLTNVYRAFDRRDENAVYDRLSLSVTGDQLTDIYLQNRQVMALENRGGARAKVDEVNILEVFEVGRSADQAILADAMWTVRGSVNHFGHTHYRQNQYRALVTFKDENGIWKISAIEPIEEIRIY